MSRQVSKERKKNRTIMIVRVLCAAKKRSLESRSSDCKSYNTHNSFTRLFSSFPAFGTQCKMEVTAGISPLGQAQQSALLLRLQACIWIFHKVNRAKTGSRESDRAKTRRQQRPGGGGDRTVAAAAGTSVVTQSRECRRCRFTRFSARQWRCCCAPRQANKSQLAWRHFCPGLTQESQHRASIQCISS